MNSSQIIKDRIRDYIRSTYCIPNDVVFRQSDFMHSKTMDANALNDENRHSITTFSRFIVDEDKISKYKDEKDKSLENKSPFLNCKKFSKEFLTSVKENPVQYFFVTNSFSSNNFDVAAGEILEAYITSDDINPSRPIQLKKWNNEYVSVMSSSITSYFIPWANLLWMKNYCGSTSPNLTKNKFALYDNFLEPLQEGDVVMVWGSLNILYFIIKSIDIFELVVEVVDLKTSHKSVFEIASIMGDFYNREDFQYSPIWLSDKFSFITKFVKAPEHVKLEFLKWKLTYDQHNIKLF